MTTILVWLLMSLPTSAGSGAPPVPGSIVERFPTKEECMRVAEWANANVTRAYSNSIRPPVMGCIQATIVVVPR